MRNLAYNQNDPWYWTRLSPNDVDKAVDLSDRFYGDEAWPLTRDRNYYKYNLTMSATEQMFNPTKELLIGAFDGISLIAVGWFDRGATSVYSPYEICNQRLIHIDPTLSARNRIKLVHQTVHQQILWAGHNGIPTCCNTSIRDDQDAFMRIMERLGFSIRGSFAYAPTGDLLENLRKQQE